jgi:hypothetical protein
MVITLKHTTCTSLGLLTLGSLLASVTARSGDDFLFGITGISGLSNPLGIEGLVSMKRDDDDRDDDLNDMPSAGKKSGGTNGTHTEGGIVKANKGMILRKSVEYIKWVVIWRNETTL